MLNRAVVNGLNNKEFQMKMKAIGLIATMLAVSVGLSCLCMAQAPTPGPEQNSPFANSPQRASSNYGGIAFGNARVNTSTAELRQAADAVRKAKGDEETNAARRKLGELIEKCFENDMVQRQRELAQLEKRLANLREQLDRRKAKKQDIVDLQMKVLLNEADGLGFFSGDSKNNDLHLNITGRVDPFGGTTIVGPYAVGPASVDATPLFEIPTPTPTAPAPAAAPVAPRAAEAR